MSVKVLIDSEWNGVVLNRGGVAHKKKKHSQSLMFRVFKCCTDPPGKPLLWTQQQHHTFYFIQLSD